MQRLRKRDSLRLWSGSDDQWKMGRFCSKPSPLCLQIRVVKQAFYSVNRANRISEMFPKTIPREKINIIP